MYSICCLGSFIYIYLTMGFETNALVVVHFNRTTFDSKHAVKEYIEEHESAAKMAKDRIRSLILMTEPQKFCPADEDPLTWLENQYKDWMELLEESNYKVDTARLVLSNWDKMHHANGCALAVPGDPQIPNWRRMEELARIDGDFIPVCNEDGSNAYPDDEVSTRLYEQATKANAK